MSLRRRNKEELLVTRTYIKNKGKEKETGLSLSLIKESR